MSLGLGINTADKGVVVELQLTVAGDVAREEKQHLCLRRSRSAYWEDC